MLPWCAKTVTTLSLTSMTWSPAICLYLPLNLGWVNTLILFPHSHFYHPCWRNRTEMMALIKETWITVLESARLLSLLFEIQVSDTNVYTLHNPKGIGMRLYKSCVMFLPDSCSLSQWRMRDFLKWGSVATSCAKFSWPRPLSIKTTPNFERLGEKLLVLPVNPLIFERDFC